ncbi:hypothetical protein EAH87_17190 [Sphingomonas koreensis]|nr:hypothetical protein EAH87_17190 [Sphingomonas koreensis]
MKMFAFLAAGLVAAASLTPTAASAQHHGRVVHERVVTRHVVRHRRGHARHHRLVCNTHWYHHRRVRRCHTVWY